MMVGVRHEGRVDLHLRVYTRLASSRSESHGSTSGSRRQLGAGRHEAEARAAARDDPFAVLVPPHVELARVALDPLGLDLVRGVPGADGEPEEEGLVGRVGVGVLDEVDGVVGQVGVEVVALLRRGRLAHRVVVVGQVGVPLVGVATEEAVVALEAAAERPAVVGPGGVALLGGVRCHLPTAKVLYAGGAAGPRTRSRARTPWCRCARGAERHLGDGRQAERVVVAPGEEAAPGRRAQRGGVEVAEAEPPLGEAVEVGRLAEASEGGELAVADVVEDDDHHVGRALGWLGSGGPRGRRRLERAPDGPGERLPRWVLDELLGHGAPLPAPSGGAGASP